MEENGHHGHRRGHSSITYKIVCGANGGTGTWKGDLSDVKPGGTIDIDPGPDTGGVKLWNFDSQVISNIPDSNKYYTHKVTLNILSTAPTGGPYTFNFQTQSCSGNNDTPEFYVDP